MNDKTRRMFLGLLEWIVAGRLAPGGPLPKEVELAAAFGTTRMNAHWAVGELENHGLVERKRHVGSFLRNNVDLSMVRALINRAGRLIYILYSAEPKRIHWDESSFAGLEETVKPAGYAVAYGRVPMTDDRGALLKTLADVEARRAAALVIFPDMFDAPRLLKNQDALTALGIPVYMLNRSGEPVPFDGVSGVSMDPLGEGAYVGRLLRGLGKRRVCFLGVAGSPFWSATRLEGIRLTLNAGQSEREIPIAVFDDESTVAVAGIVAQIAATPGEITVVAVNNEYAARLIDAAAAAGFRPPGDFDLIAFDNHPAYLAYDLTTMAQPTREIGELFGKMIVSASWDKDYAGKITVKVSSRLLVRGTLSVDSAFLPLR